MTFGTFHGRREENPGKMMFRQKGFFSHECDARRAQKMLSGKGKKTKVVTYTDGYSLYVMAPHEFWGREFIYKMR